MNCNIMVYTASRTKLYDVRRICKASEAVPSYHWHSVAILSPLLSSPVTSGMNTAAPGQVFGSVLRVSRQLTFHEGPVFNSNSCVVDGYKMHQ